MKTISNLLEYLKKIKNERKYLMDTAQTVGVDWNMVGSFIKPFRRRI